MTCPNCQKDIMDGSNFCYHCGTKQAPISPNFTESRPAKRRLMRSRTDKKIAGVCAGLADYFELDVTTIRIIWLCAILFGGTGILAYVILWIAMPLAPELAVNYASVSVTS